MNKKFFVLLGIILPIFVLLASATACKSTTSSTTPAGSAPSLNMKGIKIGSASIGGDFYVLGDATAKVLGKILKVSVENQPTQGSVDNCRLIHKKEIDVATITSRFGGYAFNATEMFAGEQPYKELRTLAGVFTFTNISVTLQNTGITKMSDLTGKKTKFGVGPDPATMDDVSKPVYEAHGLNWDTNFNRVYASYDDLYRQLGDGAIQIVTCELGGLTAEPGYMELATNKKVLIVQYDAEMMKKAGLQVALVPKGSLPGAETDSWGYLVGVGTLVATDRMSDNDAYIITKLFHENLKEISALSPNANESILNPAVHTTEVPVPYHPGAIKYWKEVGLWKGA